MIEMVSIASEHWDILQSPARVFDSINVRHIRILFLFIEHSVLGCPVHLFRCRQIELLLDRKRLEILLWGWLRALLHVRLWWLNN
jgi:hypothetical protein